MPNGPNNGTNPSTSNGTIPQVGQSSVTQMILPGSCIGVFDEASCDWATFYERVELYFEANSIPDNKKVSFLLAVIPLKTYQLLKTLCQPIAVKDKELDEINELLSNHLNPKPKILAQRCRFHKCQQLPGQPISDFVANLKKIAEDCKFDNELDSRLRDQFVCGLNIQSIVNRLLSEPDNLTFKNAVQIALSIELTTKESAEFQNKNSSVNLLKNKNRLPQGKPTHSNPNFYSSQKSSQHSNQASKGQGQSGRLCFRCGHPSHLANVCRHKDTTCRLCGKKGHLDKVCKGSKVDKSKSSANYVNVEDIVDMRSMEIVDTHTIRSTQFNGDAYLVKVKIEGYDFVMELDTGAGVTVISEFHFARICKSNGRNIELNETTRRLRSFSGELVTPKGVANVNVAFNQKRATLDLYVIRGNAPSLFGREWIDMFLPIRKWLNQVEVETNESNVSPADVLFCSKTTPSLRKSPSEPSSRITTDNCVSLLKAKYPEVFREGVGVLKGITARLFLKDDARPVFCKARSIPHSFQEKVRAELDRLEEDGIISKVESSEWATPIVPVIKTDGSIRICGDFKVTVNPQLKSDDYPLPRIEELFTSLENGRRFCKIDLSQAYLHMEVEESDRPILTLNTPKGLFQLNRLPFGIKTAPAIWQRAMERMLHGVPGISILLDDLRIAGKDDEELWSRLCLVFDRLHKYGLRINVKKCAFFVDEIEYCGHVIDKNGLHTSKTKIKAIMDAPLPENVSQLRAFLGTVNYYGRFLANLASILNPLYELLKDGQPWVWSSKCEQSFRKIKELMCSNLVLAHYNPELPIVLTCDASKYGLGAVISHIMPDGADRPIAFASRTLTSAEINYSQIDKEALGIVWGVKKFYYYLAGRRFKLITDHKPLLSIFGPKKNLPTLVATRLLHYAIFLQSFNYDIEYKPSKAISNADGLSRLPVKSEDLVTYDTAFCFHISQIEQLSINADDLAKATREDPELSIILDNLKAGKSIDNLAKGDSTEFAIHNDCLIKGIRVVIPLKFRNLVLNMLHEGHFGMVKMKMLARSHVWWPTIDQDIERQVGSCPDCVEQLKMPPKAENHHWQPCTAPWERIHIDFAGPFQNSMFLIVIDAYSKWPEVVPMQSTTSTKTIERLSEIFGRNGLPKVLVSDNGPQLTSQEFSNFLTANGIRHIKTAPFHPSSNGQAERFVQTLKKGLRSSSSSDLPLIRRLSNFLLHYRRAPHALTKRSPAELFLGRPIRSRLDCLKPQERDATFVKESSSTKFNIGDLVLARCYTGTQKWTTGRILKAVGSVHYSIQVGRDVWKRHIDQLRRSRGRNSSTSDPPNAVGEEVRVTPEIPPLPSTAHPASPIRGVPVTITAPEPVPAPEAAEPSTSAAADEIEPVPETASAPATGLIPVPSPARSRSPSISPVPPAERRSSIPVLVRKSERSSRKPNRLNL